MTTTEYRYFLNQLRERQRLSNKDLARKMGTPESLIDHRERQLERFFAPAKDEKRGPSAMFAKAVEEALGVVLPARDYGWDPSKP